MKEKRSTHSTWKRLLGILLALIMVVGLFPATVSAAEGEDDSETGPEHNKSVTQNDDGTITIALSVKGDCEKQVNKTNVIVVFDTSSSMNTDTGNGEVTYTPTDSTGGWNYQDNLYGLVDGKYVQLTRESSGYWPNITYTFYANGTTYTGQRYTRQVANQSRLQAAEAAVNELASALLDYNGVDGNPDDTVEMALVDFANMADIVGFGNPQKGYTTDKEAFTAAVNSRNAGNNDRGTNWEAGLRQALDVDFEDPSEPAETTYVIFVSDGNPTFYLNDNGTQGGNGQEGASNVQTSYNQAVPAAEALVGAGYVLYTIGVYGNVDRMEGLTTDAGAPPANYYSAENTAALQEALAEILEAIEMAGIGAVEIGDGTTSNVGTAAEPISLLSVDQSSYKYYRAGGLDADGNEKYDHEENDGLGVEWPEKTEENPDGAPPAVFEGSAVNWDLSSIGVLENDVTYTVTFVCAPGQDALDMIADLKNGVSYEKAVPEAARAYLDETGALLTNTAATLTYKDTRISDESQTVEFTPPERVPTKAQPINIKKEWLGTYWNAELNEGKGAYENEQPVTLYVYRDNDTEYINAITLDKESDPSYTTSTYLSIGIMTEKSGVLNILTQGHDYQLKELGEVSYHWELQADIMHPMLINNVLVMLVKIADEDKPEELTDDYAEVDGVKYYKIGDSYYKASASDVALKATNVRRSNLNLKKEVNGTGFPEDTTFTYDIQITLPDNVASDASERDFYYSLYDNGEYLEFENSGEKEMKDGEWTGYYHYQASSGTATISVTLPINVNLRFTNIITGTKFVMTETSQENFACSDIDISPEEPEGTPEDLLPVIDTNEATISGTVIQGNTSYQVIFTNDYTVSTVVVEKTFSGITPEQIPADFKATVSFGSVESEGEAAPEDVVLTIPPAEEEDADAGDENGTAAGDESGAEAAGDAAEAESDAIIPEVSDDGLTYTWTIPGVPEGLNVKVTEDTDSCAVEDYVLITEGDNASVTKAESEDPTEKGKVTTLELTNAYERATGSLTVEKTFEGITKDLIPEEFEITVEGAEEEYTLNAGENTAGKLSVSDDGLTLTWELTVPTGEYSVTETNAEVEDYGLLSSSVTEATAVVETGKTATAELTNEYSRDVGSLTVEKTFEGITKDLIPEEFEITVEGAEEEYTLNAGENTAGKLSVSDDGLTLTWELTVPTGEYSVTESGTDVDSYTLDEQKSTVEAEVEVAAEIPDTVETSELAKAELKNVYSRDVGSLTVEKTFEEITKDLIPEEFEITVEGPEDTYTLNTGEKTAGEFTASNDGLTLTWELTVPTGEYTVTETNAEVEDYELLSDSVTEADVTVTTDEPATAELKNVYSRDVGSLTVKKTFEEITKDLIPEEFEITVEGAENEYTLNAGENTAGKLSVSDDGLTLTWELTVPTGEYTVTETNAEVEDYELLSSSVTEATAVVETGKTATAELKNVYSRDVGSLTVKKTFEEITKDLIPEEFEITVEGPEDTYTLNTGEKTAGEFTASNDGLTLTWELTVPTGEYKVTETNAEVDGYTLTVSGDNGAAKTLEKAGATVTFSIVNTYEKNEGGPKYVHDSVNISKVYKVDDDTVVKIDGATFTLTDEKGTTIKEYSGGDFEISTKDLTKALASVEDGEFTFILTETKAPRGYVADETEHKILVKAASEEALENGQYVTTVTYTMTVDGEESAQIENLRDEGEPEYIEDSIVIHKIDANTGDPLKDAVFTLYSGDKVVKEYTSNDDGLTISTADIADFLADAEDSPVEFRLVETKAPDGYVLDDSTEYIIQVTAEAEEELSENDEFIQVITYTMTFNGEDVEEFDVENEPTGIGGPGTTTVIIEKVTTGAKTPAATVFKVEGPDGYVKELKYSDFTDGKYELKDVTAGEYTVTEDEDTAKVSGYTLKVSGDNGKKMEAEEGTEAIFKITNTYTEIEPEPEPTPEPTPRPAPPTPPELNKEDHFAYIIGNDDGTVAPDANITRAEVATIFFRLLTDESRDEYWSQTNRFIDVFPEEWFNNAVSTMANAGILKGYEDGTFRPRASITRAEFATIAIRFFQDFTSTETYFSDVSGHWGEAYINMAAEKGLIKGYPDKTFRPNAAITRAEAMAIMNRLLERHPHEDHLRDGMITWPDNMDTDAWYYADVQEATNSHEYANGINGYEIWTKILPVRDWAAFENEWSTAHSASNPGDVVEKDFSLDLSDLEDVDEDSGEPNEDDQDEEDEENDDRYIEEKNTDDQDEEDQDTDDQNNEDQDSGDDQNGGGQSRN